MSTVILPSRHTTQARGWVEINYSHPLAKDLLAAYNLTTFKSRTLKDVTNTGVYDGRKSSVGKNPYTLHGYYIAGTSEVAVDYTSFGQYFNFNGTNTSRAFTSSLTGTTGSAVRTYLIKVLLRNTTNRQFIVGHVNGGLSPVYSYGSGMYVESGVLYGIGANNNSKHVSATAPATGEWVWLTLVTGVADGRMYINGEEVASGDLASTGMSYQFAIGCDSQNVNTAGGGTGYLDGCVAETLVFTRALNQSEIKQLISNPYQVLKAKKRLWLDVVSSGVSSVDTSININFNLLNSTQETSISSWNVLTSSQSLCSPSYNILNSVSENKSVQWNTVVSVNVPTNFAWDTLSDINANQNINWNTLAGVFSNKMLEWNTITSVSTNKGVDWNIYNSTSLQLSLDWGILQSAVTNKTIDWDVLSNALTAQSSVNIEYSVLQSVFNSLSNNWNVLTNSVATSDLQWNVHNDVQNNSSLLWSISSNITSDLNVISSILGTSTEELSVIWNSAGVVDNSLVIQYSILNGSTVVIAKTIVVKKQDKSIILSKQDKSIILSKQDKSIIL
jgi:hypothetical protein